MTSCRTSRQGPWIIVAAQIAAVTAGLGTLALAPSPGGPVLLVPLLPAAAARLPTAALEAHAALLATGPLPGSLVVLPGDRPFGWAMLRRGIGAVAASRAGCGSLAGRPR